MKCACVNCLCHYCTRKNCRYVKAKQHDICSVRCIHVDDTVIYDRKPLLVCDNFVHKTLHKEFKVTKIRSQRNNSLATISLKDFLKILGGDSFDDKGN